MPSPPPPYNFASLPTIVSRYPLWEGRLEQGELRSNLDVSFANVGVQQARLLVVDTETRLGSAFADLTAALGYREPHRYILMNEIVAAPSQEQLPLLVSQALENRPDLIALRFQRDAAIKFASCRSTMGKKRLSI